jgi:hypothetical protein
MIGAPDRCSRDALPGRQRRQLCDGKIDRWISEAVGSIDGEHARAWSRRRGARNAVDLAASHHLQIGGDPRQAVALETVGLGGDERARHRLRIIDAASAAHKNRGDPCDGVADRKRGHALR